MWPWPDLIVGKSKIGSGFGMRKHPILKEKRLHKGVDITAKEGTPIRVAADGIVRKVGFEPFSKSKPSAGNYVVVEHADGYITKYMHLKEKPNLEEKSKINNGEIVGLVGNTGGSTVPHLHFQIEKNGKPMNPYDLRMPDTQLPDGTTIPGAKTDDLQNVIGRGNVASQTGQAYFNQADEPKLSERLQESKTPIVKTVGDFLSIFGL
jgi:hypothetical protein